MAIKFSDKAAVELKNQRNLEIEKNQMSPEAALRILVVGGGCAGLAYRMGFDDKVTAEDTVEELDGLRIAIDPRSYIYLDGAEVDFQEGLMGRGFVFKNPNVVPTCRCGQPPSE